MAGPWPDLSHFGNEIGFFQEFLMENYFIHLGFDWSHYDGNGLVTGQFWLMESALNIKTFQSQVRVHVTVLR